jgi:hypothetical protein
MYSINKNGCSWVQYWPEGDSESGVMESRAGGGVGIGCNCDVFAGPKKSNNHWNLVQLQKYKHRCGRKKSLLSGHGKNALISCKWGYFPLHKHKYYAISAINFLLYLVNIKISCTHVPATSRNKRWVKSQEKLPFRPANGNFKIIPFLFLNYSGDIL